MLQPMLAPSSCLPLGSPQQLQNACAISLKPGQLGVSWPCSYPAAPLVGWLFQGAFPTVEHSNLPVTNGLVGLGKAVSADYCTEWPTTLFCAMLASCAG